MLTETINALAADWTWLWISPLVVMAAGSAVHAWRLWPSAPSLSSTRMARGTQLAVGMAIVADCRGADCRWAGSHGPLAAHRLTIADLGKSVHGNLFPIVVDEAGQEHGLQPILAGGAVRVEVTAPLNGVNAWG